MTGYQKLKFENEILWKELEDHIWMLNCTEDPVKKEKEVKKSLEDIKWAIKRALYEDKD